MMTLLHVIARSIQAMKLRIPSVALTLLLLNPTVIVQWQPNNEQDLAGYKVYYGTASRSYSNVIMAGLATEQVITNLQPGHEYFFAVTAYDTAGNESQFSDEVSIKIASKNNNLISSDQNNIYNFPNPFNPEIQQTQIRYHLSKSTEVSITIFDIGGKEVRKLLKNVIKSPGEHIEDSWDGRDENGNLMPNGIYYANVYFESSDHYITIAITK